MAQRTYHTELPKQTDWETAAYFALLIAVIRRAERDAQPRRLDEGTAPRRQEAQSFLEWVRDVWRP